MSVLIEEIVNSSNGLTRYIVLKKTQEMKIELLHEGDAHRYWIQDDEAIELKLALRVYQRDILLKHIEQLGIRDSLTLEIAKIYNMEYLLKDNDEVEILRNQVRQFLTDS
jgi:hypothetical protein